MIESKGNDLLTDDRPAVAKSFLSLGDLPPNGLDLMSDQKEDTQTNLTFPQYYKKALQTMQT